MLEDQTPRPAQVELEDLEEPDLTVGPLKVWVHGREFPQATDYWDGNWLKVTAYCAAPGAGVWVKGPILHLSEVVGLLRGCESLYENLAGRALLDCREPYLRVELAAARGGRIGVTVLITPNHLEQFHRFQTELDQTYLPAIITACRRLLEQYPLRGD